VRCIGKGRKTRCIPLRKDTVTALRAWLRERGGLPTDVFFPNARGAALSRDGVEYLLAKHMATARVKCPAHKTKRVSAHVLRHTLAMDLLQAVRIVQSSRYGSAMNTWIPRRCICMRASNSNSRLLPKPNRLREHLGDLGRQTIC
jgi:hypothetical protein